jgi:hypothetical protein
VQRQLAAATGTTIQQVIETLYEIRGDTDTDIVTTADLREYAKRTRASLYWYTGGQIAEAVRCDDRDRHNPAIVVATWCGLTYFYKGAGKQAVADAQRLRKPAPRATQAPQAPQAPRPRALCKSVRHPPPVEDFEPFPYYPECELADVPAGSYWIPSEDMGDGKTDYHIEGVLKRFIQSRRFPRAAAT